MDMRFLILSFLLLLTACLPDNQVSKGSVASQGAGSPGIIDTTIPQSETQWNYLAGNFKTITIYASNLNNAYLTGYQTEFYLSKEENFKDQNYCLVSDFNLAGTKHQMRTRVVPVSYYDFAAKRTVKVFRADFNVISSEVETICSQDLYSYNSLGEYTVDTAVPPSVVYSADALCPTCTARLTTTKLRLFKVQTDLYEIPSPSIKLSALALIVDPNSGNSGGNGTCSISSCQSQGYDCCLENQCVDNSAIRPSARTLYPDQLLTAEEERLTDPLSWLRYPHIYYVCPNYIPPNPGATTGSTSGGGSGGIDYGEGLVQIKKDLSCLENIKNQSQTIPFHQELLVNLSYSPATECLTGPSEESQLMHFKNVAKRLYQYCGCSYSELSDMITHCPAYYYRVSSSNSAGEATSFECSILTEPSIPITQQVSVNSRSAPHRFFNSSGTEFAGPEQSPTAQELDQFSYEDEENNIHSQEKFGINSIIGPMSVQLNRALPAKVVSVELDQMYLIRTISGYYTPCPSCGKDRWHESLTAFPSSNWGVGLQAIGFSTQRDQIDGNISGGNYEDTIFGRACFVPPTMLPFSHRAVSGIDATPQRRARLETQAVLYANGYQRDWFGFNKGALIGSFDGVSWFAVGNGRLVKSASKKLFLAINAPFADLATPSIHQVQVSLYSGHSTAPQVDYDPQYHSTDSSQNQAGSCQANHLCQTDSDCITRLGWEYACADVARIKTSWPSFDLNAKENIGSTFQTLDQILAQKKFPSGDTKRCVYRGAGSICLSNSNSITDLNEKKVMTCAPNFYCAPLASSSNISSRVSRYGTNLDNLIVSNNHLFGQDANVLGRPLNYMGENESIPLASRQTLSNNLQENHPTLYASGAGICRPGKSLPTSLNQVAMSNPFEQQKAADSSRRTDFINQIASCNASLYTMYRQSSCPVINKSSGNYVHFESATLPANFHLLAGKQNACGLESISTDLASLNSSLATLHTYSAFREIEARPLSEQVLTDKSLIRDACLRRAGAVCHTDLDCSPNKMHAENAEIKSLKFFGNLAEKNYWQEYLVCGQAEAKPSIYDTEASKNFNPSLNRCCREVGKDLTVITANSPSSTISGQIHEKSLNLMTPAYSGTAANAANRYSRLNNVENLGSATRPFLSASTQRNGAGNLTLTSNISVTQQWKTLRDSNSQTCCGGGWIRKFSDGDNNWSQANRVVYDVSNFSCLNSAHPILTIPENISSLYASLADVRNLINKDYSEYCQDLTGTFGSCAQSSFSSSADTEGNPTANPFSAITINTLSGNFGAGNTDYLFTPFSGDAHTGVTMVYNSVASGARKNLSLRIPSYIPRTAFDSIYSATASGATTQGIFVVSDGASISCTKQPALNPTSHTDASSCSSGQCCYSFDLTSRILKVAVAASASMAIRDNESGVRFNVDLADLNSIVTRTTPANDLYYLNRLARIELSGIPQMTFEPIYCNDNANALMPGMFRSTLMKTKSEFENNTHSFISNGKWQTTHHALEQPAVFSEDQFKCCTPLGKTTKNSANCCSGHGTLNNLTNTYTCSLPSGTDLMVYLNPLVSNEGFNLSMQETDFNNSTGEPTFSSATINKISQIGRDHCVGKKVRQGGAFGNFAPEPQGTRTDASKRMYQILDSLNDVGQVTNAGATMPSGYNVFNEGYRWNHHLYCTE